MESSKLKNFEFEIHRRMSDWKALEGSRLLLAVSGGLDSMVLLNVMGKLQARWGFRLLVGHVVHQSVGPLSDFRQKAKDCVKQACEKLDCEMLSSDQVKDVPNGLKVLSEKPNEQEWRDYRWKWLIYWATRFGCTAVATAHHRQDQLETRLIRLIRGTGLAGLKAMSGYEPPTEGRVGKLRPLLNFGREQILDYAKNEQLNWVEDPSNQNEHFLRNWIRQNWLKTLESHRPGASETIFKSLETIVAEASIEPDEFKDFYLENDGERLISLEKYLSLAPTKQKRLLAEYMNLCQFHGFSQGQLQEIIKRLDTAQKNPSFKVAGCLWEVNAGQIKARRL